MMRRITDLKAEHLSWPMWLRPEDKEVTSTHQRCVAVVKGDSLELVSASVLEQSTFYKF